MRKLGWMALVLAMTVAGPLAQQSDAAKPDLKPCRECERWINRVMSAISDVKPGITRKDLAPLLRLDGGMQFPAQGRYVLVEYPYIKLNVEFSVVAEGADFGSDDKVVNVSRPYWEYPFSD
jgi:hypothetical protein